MQMVAYSKSPPPWHPPHSPGMQEGVPQLAMKCFDTIRKWVGDGKELTHKILSDNQLLILKINEVVGHSIAMAVRLCLMHNK